MDCFENAKKRMDKFKTCRPQIICCNGPNGATYTLISEI